MLGSLYDTGMMAHGYCLLWQPWLISLHAGADLLIFAAYTAIPVALFGLLRRRPELRDGRLVALFGSFILLCGLAHLVSVVTLWVPIYPLHGTLKLLTGIVSVATAAMLFPLIPRLAALPHPAELDAANRALLREGEERRAALARLREERGRLEREVALRTRELAASNERLRAVTRETVHRKKNLLTVVQALARQTALAEPDPTDFVRAFGGRLDALSRAHAATVHAGDENPDLDAVLRAQVVHVAGGERVRLSGPPVALSPEAGQQIALAAHELATNALKHGALHGASGTVSISWRVADPGPAARLVLDWRERFEPGPDAAFCGEGAAAGPADGAGLAAREGLGTALLTRVVPSQLGGRAVRHLSAEGLTWRLDVPLGAISPAPPHRAEGAAEGPVVSGGPPPLTA